MLLLSISIFLIVCYDSYEFKNLWIQTPFFLFYGSWLLVGFKGWCWYYLLALAIPGGICFSKNEVVSSNRFSIIDISSIANVRVTKNSKEFLLFLVAYKVLSSYNTYSASSPEVLQYLFLTLLAPKYANFADIFPRDIAAELQEHTGINEYAINLIDSH